MTPTQKGDITVAVMTAKFLRLGYVVLKPLSESSRYDLVIDRGKGFERVQCKTGRIRRGAMIFNSSSNHWHRKGATKPYLGEADLFGVYCPDNDECYLIPVPTMKNVKSSLRVSPARNGQKAGIIQATEYLLS